MFAAPPAVTAEILATIPDKFHKRGVQSDWVDIQFHGADTPTFLEGPEFDAEGNLWCTDIPWGRLFRITPSGEVSLGLKYDGQPNGLKFTADGRCLIADHHRGILLFDPASGSIRPFIEHDLLEPFLGCNDLTVAANGDLYFTDMGQSGLHRPNGRLYRYDTGERLEVLLDNVPSPNGLVINKAQTTLYLAVTRANAVWKVPIMPDRRVSKVGVWVQLSGGTSGPDGLAIDEEDNVIVCHNGFGATWVFSAVVGELLLRINSPTGTYMTNCAFGR